MDIKQFVRSLSPFDQRAFAEMLRPGHGRDVEGVLSGIKEEIAEQEACRLAKEHYGKEILTAAQKKRYLEDQVANATILQADTAKRALSIARWNTVWTAVTGLVAVAALAVAILK
jgi:hypothetical protein